MRDLQEQVQLHPNRATDHLLRKMWKTKSARFNAHARLMSRHRMSITSTSALACYLIAASILQLTLPATAAGDFGKLITSSVLILSVFLLMITLTESARSYATEADRMHRSALEISELYNRFQALDISLANIERGSFNDKYSAILKNAEVNHKTIDFLRFKITYYEDFSTRKIGLFFLIIHFMSLWFIEYALYIIMIVGPAVVFFILINRLEISMPTVLGSSLLLLGNSALATT